MTTLPHKDEPRCSSFDNPSPNDTGVPVMLRCNLTDPQMNDFLLCALQEATLDIEMETAHKKQPQPQQEKEEEVERLFDDACARIYQIAPNFPQIEIDVVIPFMFRGPFSTEPFCYLAAPQAMNCNMNEAQMNALLFCVYKAEYLLMRFPRPYQIHHLSARQQGGLYVQLYGNMQQRMRKIVPDFPSVDPNTAVNFGKYLFPMRKPFAYF